MSENSPTSSSGSGELYQTFTARDENGKFDYAEARRILQENGWSYSDALSIPNIFLEGELNKLTPKAEAAASNETADPHVGATEQLVRDVEKMETQHAADRQKIATLEGQMATLQEQLAEVLTAVQKLPGQFAEAVRTELATQQTTPTTETVQGSEEPTDGAGDTPAETQPAEQPDAPTNDPTEKPADTTNNKAGETDTLKGILAFDQANLATYIAEHKKLAEEINNAGDSASEEQTNELNRLDNEIKLLERKTELYAKLIGLNEKGHGDGLAATAIKAEIMKSRGAETDGAKVGFWETLRAKARGRLRSLRDMGSYIRDETWGRGKEGLSEIGGGIKDSIKVKDPERRRLHRRRILIGAGAIVAAGSVAVWVASPAMVAARGSGELPNDIMPDTTPDTDSQIPGVEPTNYTDFEDGTVVGNAGHEHLDTWGEKVDGAETMPATPYSTIDYLFNNNEYRESQYAFGPPSEVLDANGNLVDGSTMELASINLQDTADRYGADGDGDPALVATHALAYADALPDNLGLDGLSYEQLQEQLANDPARLQQVAEAILEVKQTAIDSGNIRFESLEGKYYDSMYFADLDGDGVPELYHSDDIANGGMVIITTINGVDHIERLNCGGQIISFDQVPERWVGGAQPLPADCPPPVEQYPEAPTGKSAEQDSSKSIEDDTSKSAEHDSSKSDEDDSSKSIEHDSSKSAEEDSSKTAEDDSSKSVEEDSSKSTEEDSSKSAEEDSSKTDEEDSSKSAEEDSSKSAEEDSSKTDEEKSNNPDDYIKPGDDDTTDSGEGAKPLVPDVNEPAQEAAPVVEAPITQPSEGGSVPGGPSREDEVIVVPDATPPSAPEAPVLPPVDVAPDQPVQEDAVDLPE